MVSVTVGYEDASRPMKTYPIAECLFIPNRAKDGSLRVEIRFLPQGHDAPFSFVRVGMSTPLVYAGGALPVGAWKWPWGTSEDFVLAPEAVPAGAYFDAFASDHELRSTGSGTLTLGPVSWPTRSGDSATVSLHTDAPIALEDSTGSATLTVDATLNLSVHAQ